MTNMTTFKNNLEELMRNGVSLEEINKQIIDSKEKITKEEKEKKANEKTLLKLRESAVNSMIEYFNYFIPIEEKDKQELTNLLIEQEKEMERMSHTILRLESLYNQLIK